MFYTVKSLPYIFSKREKEAGFQLQTFLMLRNQLYGQKSKECLHLSKWCDTPVSKIKYLSCQNWSPNSEEKLSKARLYSKCTHVFLKATVFIAGHAHVGLHHSSPGMKHLQGICSLYSCAFLLWLKSWQAPNRPLWFFFSHAACRSSVRLQAQGFKSW